MVPREILDHSERREAIVTPHHAFVWASAGTGKTHTLTLRALYLLLLPEESDLYKNEDRATRLRATRRMIQSVVLTTFTRKAAAEMQTRLYIYLDRIVSSPDLSALQEKQANRRDPLFLELVEALLEKLPAPRYGRLRQGAEALAELAAELQISTLHSLAASILRRHPLAAGLPADVRFSRDDEEEMMGIDDQLVERWWQKEVLANPDLQEDLEQILPVLPVRQVRRWLKEVFRHRWIADRLADCGSVDPQQLQSLLEACRRLVAALAGGGGARIEQVRDKLASLCSQAERQEPAVWSEFCRFIGEVRKYFYLDGRPPKTVRRAIEQLDRSHRFFFEAYLHSYRPVLAACLSRKFSQEWSAWCRLIVRFRHWVDNACLQELRLVTFDDMIRLATQVLEENPAVKAFETGRLRAVLVDEFQDTDPAQLRFLTALLRREEHSSREILGFFVGDLKQSIYRFRGAEVSSIDRFRRDYEQILRTRIPLREFQLKTSFRSLPTVTRFVNEFFSSRLPLTQPEEELRPVRSGSGEPPPTWIQLDQDSDGNPLTAEAARDEAARHTVRLIREYMSLPGSAYRDILVLAKTHRELDSLLPHLHEGQIPVVAGGTKTFYRNHELLDVLNLLIALHHPLDTLAVAAVLRSPLVQLSDDQIHRLVSKIPAAALFHRKLELPPELPEIPKSRIQEIRRLARRRLRLPLEDWLREIDAFLPKGAYVRAQDREGRSLVRIERLLQSFAEEVGAGLLPPLVWLLQQRDRAAEGDQWDANLGEDVSIVDENLEAVRAMTIHKAKGLQSRFVIVYGWGTVLAQVAGRNHRERPAALNLSTPQQGRIQAFSLEWGPLQVTTVDYQRALAQEEEQEREEGLRLAYVSATRAADRLVLLNTVPATRLPAAVADLLNLPQQGSAPEWLEMIAAQHPPHLSPLPAPVIQIQDRNVYRELWRQRYREVSELTALLRTPSGKEDPRPEVREPGDYTASRVEQGLRIGRLVHSYLERHLTEPSFSPARLQALMEELQEHHGEEIEQEVKWVLENFFSDRLVDAQGQPYRQRVLKNCILGREVPVFLSMDGVAWNGILDLILQEHGSVVGIDYKTRRAVSPLPPSYHRQERVYSEALRRLFPAAVVRFEFWWLEQEHRRGESRRQLRLLL